VSEPITKKLSEILAENDDLAITAVNRKTAHCNRFLSLWGFHIGDLEMRWNENWNAWSHRPASGVYQQIIIFMPEVDAE